MGKFWKKTLGVVSAALPVAGSIFGPVGTAVGAAAGSAIQGGVAQHEKNKAERELNRALKNTPKYEWEKSESQKEMERVAAEGMGGMPTMELMERRLGAQTSMAVTEVERTTASGADMTSAVERAYAREMAGLNTLMVQDIEYRDRAKQMYMTALGQGASAETAGKLKEFETNVMMPWQLKTQVAAERMAAAGAQASAGWQNVMSSVTQGAIGMMGSSQLRGILGNNGAAVSSSGGMGAGSMGTGYNFYNPSTWGSKLNGGGMNLKWDYKAIP